MTDSNLPADTALQQFYAEMTRLISRIETNVYTLSKNSSNIDSIITNLETVIETTQSTLTLIEDYLQPHEDEV